MGSIKKAFDLTGKNALVTGGSRGLGLQIAEALGEQGARVVISSRKAPDLEKAQAHLAGLGIKAEWIAADNSKDEDVKRLADETIKKLGRVDILVNNAGATWGAPTEDHPIEAWDKVMNLNIRSLFLLSQQVAKHSMIPNKYGRIINLASIAGLFGSSGDMQMPDGGIRRPRRHAYFATWSMNAIDDALLDVLAATFAMVEAHSEVSVLRIRSEPRAFSAGADLRLVAGRLESTTGADEMRATVRRFHEVYDQLAALPLVTIAEIEGHALGGGLELALACDIRIASHTAKLGLPETKVGLLPGAGGTQRLTRLCGEGIAARIILSGDVVGGREAERIGLVQWAFAAADFSRSAAEIVSRTAKLSADAQKIAKNCIRLAVHEQTRGAQAEIEGIWTLMRSAETKKRVHRFLRN